MAKTVLGSGNDISHPLDAYQNARIAMRLPDALLGGTEEMRKYGIDYLPMEPGESEEKYVLRLNRTVLFEAYGRTIEKLTGEVFREAITISEDIDEDVQEWLEDIDRKGNDITVFMADFLAHGIHEGCNHFMVEYPPSPGKTKADHKAAGARPYLVLIRPEQIIGWRFTDGILTQLRVKESVMVDDGLYGQKEVERIRLYEPGRWAVYEEGKDGWELAMKDGSPMEGATNLPNIPLVSIFLGKKTSDMTTKSPMLPLAYLNVTHWQSASDQRNILHYARMMTWFGKFIEEDEDGKVLMGANRIIRSENESGDLKVVEHSGAAIEAGRQDLEDLKTEMALFGLSLLIGKTGTVTATEKGIDTAENASALSLWVRHLNSALTRMLKIMGMYVNKEISGTLAANDDFSGFLRNEDPALLLSAFEAGLLPRDIVVEELKLRGVISQELDLKDLVAQLADDQKTGTPLDSLAGAFGASSTTDQAVQQ